MSVWKQTILEQLNLSWSLLELHLDAVSEQECHWQPRSRGLTVRREGMVWTADWPDHEGYDIGPPNIAWLTWHIIFWWSMTLDHTFASGTMERESVIWPGSMEAAAQSISALHRKWVKRVQDMPEEELLSPERVKWPFRDRPFCELAVWLNAELMKNAAEIGYCRFLYATRE